MSPRARRIVLTVALLVAIQAALVAGYVVATRTPAPTDGFRSAPLAGTTAVPLEVEAPDGSVSTIGGPGDRVVLVHFWATWCEPCRKELPGLVERMAQLERAGRVRLVAIAVDDTWADIRAFFGGPIPAAIVRAREPEGHRRWGADLLPDTYVVDRQGRLVERYLGARDWRSEAARTHLDVMLDRHAAP